MCLNRLGLKRWGHNAPMLRPLCDYVPPQPLYDAPTMCPLCAHYVAMGSMGSRWSYNAHTMYVFNGFNEFWCEFDGPTMRYAPTMRPLRAHCLFKPLRGEIDGRTMHAPTMRPLCAHYAAPLLKPFWG